ncbi:MAG: FHA domain-containing protein [Planctomycetota bacterium]
MEKQPTSQRGLLWVDAVGGFLFCFGDTVTLGQATPDHDVELPIVGDVSRRHATLRRVDGEYLLDPIAVTCVGGRVVKGATVLADGDEIWLGQKVHLRFRKPHPLSNTVRLEMLGHHQWEPTTDAAILLAETCVLGPSPQDHICCPYWEQPLVLSAAESGLWFRAQERVEIDGVQGSDQGELRWGTRLSGDNFAVRLERL